MQIFTFKNSMLIKFHFYKQDFIFQFFFNLFFFFPGKLIQFIYLIYLGNIRLSCSGRWRRTRGALLGSQSSGTIAIAHGNDAFTFSIRMGTLVSSLHEQRAAKAESIGCLDWTLRIVSPPLIVRSYYAQTGGPFLDHRLNTHPVWFQQETANGQSRYHPSNEIWSSIHSGIRLIYAT